MEVNIEELHSSAFKIADVHAWLLYPGSFKIGLVFQLVFSQEFQEKSIPGQFRNSSQ